VLASVALICAGVLDVTDVVFTVKVVLVELAPILTDVGTVASETLLNRLMVVALNAAELRATVHVDVAGGVTVAGLQFSVDSTGADG
jgi:hypothetical protein